jgi:hypothetical protein
MEPKYSSKIAAVRLKVINFKNPKPGTTLQIVFF